MSARVTHHCSVSVLCRIIAQCLLVRRIIAQCLFVCRTVSSYSCIVRVCLCAFKNVYVTQKHGDHATDDFHVRYGVRVCSAIVVLI